MDALTQHLCACGRPSPDATICPACAYRLTDALTDVTGPRGLAYDLDVTLTRQARLGDRTGSRPTEVDKDVDDDGRQWPGTLRPTAMPYDARASEVAAHLKGVLAGWARVVAEETGVYADTNRRGIGPICRRCDHASCRAIPAIPEPPDTLAGLAAWLQPRVGWLRHHAAAAEAHDEIVEAVRAARRVIDRPADRLYAGPCDECGGDLYARPGALAVECRPCELVYEVEARRAWLLAALEEHLATTIEISRALTSLAQPVTPAAIRGYAHRGQLIPRGVNDRRHPLYRLGDVLDILTRQAERVAS